LFSVLEGVREIIKNPKALENVFKRVYSRYLGTCPDLDIINKIGSHEQVLCIVNTRAHARKLFSLLSKSDGQYHLSALMCPEHRTLVLIEIRERLARGKRCRVISTQLVEASIAGVDSIVQSAGRCNREGNIEGGGWINVFMPETGLPKGAFKQNAEITMSVLNTFGDNLLSGDAVKAYFNDLYWRKSLGNSLDEKQILNDCKIGEAKLCGRQKPKAGYSENCNGTRCRFIRSSLRN
jgi:CRISPR-associated endonuclease/helicase Cas3